MGVTVRQVGAAVSHHQPRPQTPAVSQRNGVSLPLPGPECRGHWTTRFDPQRARRQVLYVLYVVLIQLRSEPLDLQIYPRWRHKQEGSSWLVVGCSLGPLPAAT